MLYRFSNEEGVQRLVDKHDRRMVNVNRDQMYQYVNQQITYTFRIHDYYRSWAPDKRRSQTTHKERHTPYGIPIGIAMQILDGI